MKFQVFQGFSKKFRIKRYFEEISRHFRDTYCVDPHDFLNYNSLCAMFHREFASDNSLLPKRCYDFSNDNSVLPKMRPIVYQLARSVFTRTFVRTFVEKSREQRTKFAHFAFVTFAQYCSCKQNLSEF